MLSAMQRKRQEETKKEALKILNKYGKCVVLRPTGFGKTTIMSNIALEEPTYKNILYVYPSESIMHKVRDIIRAEDKKVTYITYMRLSLDNGDLREEYNPSLNNFDLIIFDEIHHMGAELAKKSIEVLLNSIDVSRTHVIGGTATPFRSDSFDMIDKFFDNRVVKSYTMNEAINDGIIPKPYYVYASTALIETERIRSKGVKSIDPILIKEFETDIRTIKGQLNTICNASYILRTGISKAFKNNIPSYLKFVVFTSKVSILKDRKHAVEGWFQTAFPKYEVNSIEIHSLNADARDLRKIDALQVTPNKIDLIFSVNMLNEGIHMENLTGVVMLRPTKSHTIYTQQAGRCLQVGLNYNPIIFDFVDNVSINMLFNQKRKDSDAARKSLQEQMVELNSIDRENVHLIDQVKKANEILDKLDKILPTDIETRVIEHRKQLMPAQIIADELGIMVWEVLRVLDKYEVVLKKNNLEKREADYWTKGYPNSEGLPYENTRIAEENI